MLRFWVNHTHRYCIYHNVSLIVLLRSQRSPYCLTSFSTFLTVFHRFDDLISFYQVVLTKTNEFKQAIFFYLFKDGFGKVRNYLSVINVIFRHKLVEYKEIGVSVR